MKDLLISSILVLLTLTIKLNKFTWSYQSLSYWIESSVLYIYSFFLPLYLISTSASSLKEEWKFFFFFGFRFEPLWTIYQKYELNIFFHPQSHIYFLWLLIIISSTNSLAQYTLLNLRLIYVLNKMKWMRDFSYFSI